MRAVWIAIALGACGDNTEPPRLEPLVALPAATQDVVFDRDDVAVVRREDGTLQRFVDGRWRTVATLDVQPTDFGSDNDGTLLVMSTVPRMLYQLDGGVMREVGGLVLANFVHMPMQVPSGNRYVKEIMGEQRSFVLSPGTSTWVETPPMFVSRPVRAYDNTLYAAVASGVERFATDGTRPLVVTCAALGKPSCTGLVLGGADRGRVYVGDIAEPDVIVVNDGGLIERVALPGRLVPVRIAAGQGLTVVLAKEPASNPALETYSLFVLDDRGVVRIEAADDPPTSATRLVVDHRGTVHVASQSLSTVVR